MNRGPRRLFGRFSLTEQPLFLFVGFHSKIGVISTFFSALTGWKEAPLSGFEFTGVVNTMDETYEQNRRKIVVPVWEKTNLTLEEAAAYSGIGIHKLRELSNDRRCEFVLFVGSKRLIKRKLFDAWIEDKYSL